MFYLSPKTPFIPPAGPGTVVGAPWTIRDLHKCYHLGNAINFGIDPIEMVRSKTLCTGKDITLFQDLYDELLANTPWNDRVYCCLHEEAGGPFVPPGKNHSVEGASFADSQAMYDMIKAWLAYARERRDNNNPAASCGAIPRCSQRQNNFIYQLVKKVVTSSATGRGGVVGLEDTLSAVHEGRMQTLVLRDGYRAPGFRCLGCGYITTQMLSDCPFCGGGFENIPDAVESALHKFMQIGDDINVLFQDHVIPGFENIGGLLRY